MIYEKDNIEQAVPLAERFRQEGRYDLFRGQRENWPVVPTLARLNEEEAAAAQERYKVFFSWIEQQPELVALGDRDDRAIVDQKFAIAQHYGLPTLFCDFILEPRVAGFFASSSDRSEGTGTSVILCCNSHDLISWCKQDVCEFPGGSPEILRIAVPNLWRLEAQAGVFVFLSVPDFESWYEFDRITFPRGLYTGIGAEDVYPTGRSRLEVLLDQYFGFDIQVAHHDWLMAMANRDHLVISVSRYPEETIQEYFLHGDPGPHQSWSGASHDWRSYQVEKRKPGSETARLHICDDLRAAPAEIGRRCESGC
jgi:hypothetical protein